MEKRMRKLTAILLALVLLITIPISAFGAEDLSTPESATFVTTEKETQPLAGKDTLAGIEIDLSAIDPEIYRELKEKLEQPIPKQLDPDIEIADAVVMEYETALVDDEEYTISHYGETTSDGYLFKLKSNERSLELAEEYFETGHLVEVVDEADDNFNDKQGDLGDGELESIENKKDSINKSDDFTIVDSGIVDFSSKNEIGIVSGYEGETTEIVDDSSNDVYSKLEEESSDSEGDNSNIDSDIDPELAERVTSVRVVIENINLFYSDNLEDIAVFARPEEIEYIEPNYQMKLFTPNLDSESYFNDSLYQQQWHLDYTRAYLVPYSGKTASSSIIIGVLDSGVNSNHPDLNASNFVTGYNYIDNNTTTTDKNGHGTMVTGVIAARANNANGIASAAPNVKIRPYVVGDEYGFINNDAAASAIRDAVDNRTCHILNMSFGGTINPQGLKDAIEYAYDNNVWMIASAGNQNATVTTYPASYPQVVSVSGVNRDGTNVWTKNSFVNIVAPASNILTTKADGGYGYNTGTSFAAPQVTALAAIYRSHKSGATMRDFLNFLPAAVKFRTPTSTYGIGILDFGSAITLLRGGQTVCTFGDVTSTRWSYNYIHAAMISGVQRASLTDRFYFKPTDAVNRRDFVTSLGRLRETRVNIPYKNDTFPDTEKGKYYNKYVAWGQSTGIAVGSNGYYYPTQNITREQAATMVYRYATTFCGARPVSSDIYNLVMKLYSDSGQISSYAKDAVAWCYYADIMRGTSTTVFNPKGNITREQFSKVLVELYRNYGA